MINELEEISFPDSYVVYDNDICLKMFLPVLLHHLFPLLGMHFTLNILFSQSC